MDNMIFNVKFTRNHAKDPELVDVDINKKRFYM